MLTSQELRIGNLLYYHLTEDVCEVNYIGEKSFDCKTELGSMAHGVYDPIPLTKEWLLKIGFDKEKDHKWKDGSITPEIYVFKSYFIEFTNIYTVVVLARMNRSGGEFIRSVKFVHEIQNLIFALTGEELKVNISQNACLWSVRYKVI